MCKQASARLCRVHIFWYIEVHTAVSYTHLDVYKRQQKVRSVNCGLCGNNCQLTVNIFPGGKKYISGNRCDRPVSHRGEENPLNLYEYTQRLLAEYKPQPGIRGTIGIPLGPVSYTHLDVYKRQVLRYFCVRPDAHSLRYKGVYHLR